MLATSLGSVLYYYAVKALKFPPLTALDDVQEYARRGDKHQDQAPIKEQSR
jgi:hypothetical protein